MPRVTANALLILAAFFWGAGNVASKTVLDDLGPYTAVGLRCLIATLIILPFCRPAPRLARDHLWLPGLLLVVALFVAAMIFQQIAFVSTSVSNVSFLVNTETILTPLIAWLFLSERPARVIAWTAFITLVGAFLMSGASLSKVNIGDVACLVSAVLYAGWLVALSWYVQRYNQAGFVAICQFAGTALIGLAIGLPFEPISGERLIGAAPELLVLGVFATAAAFGILIWAQRFTSASAAAVIVASESVFGAGAAAILLGERLSPMGLLGATLILIAIFVTVLAPLDPPKKADLQPVRSG
jgi:drug/metabolite transporter (DMT)-like permease